MFVNSTKNDINETKHWEPIPFQIETGEENRNKNNVPYQTYVYAGEHELEYRARALNNFTVYLDTLFVHISTILCLNFIFVWVFVRRVFL